MTEYTLQKPVLVSPIATFFWIFGKVHHRMRDDKLEKLRSLVILDRLKNVQQMKNLQGTILTHPPPGLK